MPIALDPKAVFRVVLESDQGKDPRPAFLYRHLSASKIRQIEEVMRRLRADKAGPDTWPKIESVILAGLAGWENIFDESGNPILYDPANPKAIFDICTDRELGELMVKIMAGRMLDADDRKKSEPQPAVDTANSAGAAEVS